MKPKINLASAANLTLAGIAFCFFIANQINVFGGQRLNLTTVTGRYLLAGFLGVGLLVQLAKIGLGHQHWLELSFTLFLLVIHAAAELIIWFGVQVVGIAIPTNLPEWIIGLYWTLGLVEIMSIYGPRELALFNGGPSEDERTAQALAAERMARQQAELAARLAQQEARLTQQFAEQIRQNQAYGSAIAPAKEVQIFTKTCPDCGTVLQAPTARGAINALNGHKTHCVGPKVFSDNGHKE